MGDLLGHAAIRVRFGNGSVQDWEFEKAGRVVKVSPPGKLVNNHPALARRAALDGLGYVGGEFHTDHEWIDLNSITPRLYLFTRLLMELGAKPH